LPTIATGPDGLIGVTWYDRRDDPQDYAYNLYYTQSTDGGLDWSANRKVSNSSSDPGVALDFKAVGDVGFYGALVYGTTPSGTPFVLPSWVDSRRAGTQDFYTDRGLLCQAQFQDVSPSDY